ncbi:unnamed protein product [Cunninghamella echinulata]
MASPLTSLIVNSRSKHTATVVFLHGLGDSGAGWSFLAEELSNIFPNIKWVLPNAPSRPITLNAGFKMPGWFDITGLDKSSLNDEMKKEFNQIIRQEVENGIPSERIIVGGFSQGGVMSLLTGLTSEYKFGGVIGCSCWLALAEKMKTMGSEANKKTPVLMCHGTVDNVVQYQFGKESSEALKNYGYDVTFKSYPGLAHSASPQELRDISDFIKARLG